MAMNAVSAPIVCGIGGPHAGRRVATFAAALAGTLGAPLTLVRAEAVAELGGSRTALQRGQARLGDVLSHSGHESDAVTRTVRLGDPATVLVAVAGELRAQLLLVGGGSAAPPFGAIARKLAMRAACPIIVLPRRATATPADGWRHRHVLCAFDGSDDARATLGVAAAFADRMGAAAFVAHIRPGSLHELGERAHNEQAALIVAPGSSADPRACTRAGPAQNGPATPLLLVPPAYRAGAGPPVRAAAAV
jgi:nucleotide-binding universal stress UspA family protein